MAVTKDITWAIGPEKNGPIATGYISLASGDTLTSIIDCGFKPSMVEVTFAVLGSASPPPFRARVIRGVSTTVDSGNTDIDSHVVDAVSTSSHGSYGVFHDTPMSANDDGCHGWRLEGSTLTLLYTHVSFVFYR